MESLPLSCDIFQYICYFLCDKDKCSIIRCNKILSKKCFPLFIDSININKIIGTIRYNKYTNIIINKLDNGFRFPLLITHLTFGYYFNQPINDAIPSSVTHLTFGGHFNQPINDAIPSSVTHLIFGWNFNQPINDAIPSSVTHLTFGYSFNQPINDAIPSSVTHLTFDYYFNQSINDAIPSSITHLTFGS